MGRGRAQAVGRRNRFAVKEGYISSVAFSPDGKTIAAGYGEYSRRSVVGGVVLWDVAARKRLAEEPLAVKEGNVQSVAFSPDGKTIAAGYGDVVGLGCVGGVVLWDVAARKRLADEPLTVKEGDVVERGLQPRRQDHRGRIRRQRWQGGVVLWDVAGASGWRTSRSP